MVQRIHTEILDDIDGSSEGVETHTFSLDGRAYAIDLGPVSFKLLKGVLESFIEKARPSAGLPVSRPRSRPQADRERSAAIRTWAEQAGLDVQKRGRLSAEVIAVYDAAHAA